MSGPRAQALVRLRVLEVRTDGTVPSMLLQEEDGRRCVAFPVGLGEIQALSAGLGEVKLTRPLPHDLLAQTLRLGGLELVHAEILGPGAGCGCQAELCLRSGDGVEHRLRARPADAVAVALRTGAPILIAEEALHASRWVSAPAAPPSLPLDLALQQPEPRRPCVTPRALPTPFSPRRPKWRM